MEIRLKGKYRRYKPVKSVGKKTGGNSGASHKKITGNKTYVYGSRIMVVDPLRGTHRMTSGLARGG